MEKAFSAVGFTTEKNIFLRVLLKRHTVKHTAGFITGFLCFPLSILYHFERYLCVLCVGGTEPGPGTLDTSPVASGPAGLRQCEAHTLPLPPHRVAWVPEFLSSFQLPMRNTHLSLPKFRI